MNDLIQQPVIGHDIINISRCPYYFSAEGDSHVPWWSEISPFLRFGYPCRGMIAVTVTASHIINKQSFQKTTGTGTETWVGSWIAEMPTAIEWSRLTSILSEVVDVAGLVFPTLGQGVTFGTVHSCEYYSQ